MKKVRFIIDHRAGGARKTARITESVRDILEFDEGVFEISPAKTKEAVEALSKEAVRKGYEAVVACGGETTINEAASGLVSTNTALGVIPLGKGNGFARSLGIPEDIAGAVGLVKRWNIRDIDVGVICGRYFLSTAGCALEAAASMTLNRGPLGGRLKGLVPYAPVALLEFLKYRPEEVTLKSERHTASATPLLLTAANTERYGGGAVIAPGARPDDGLLDVCIVKTKGLLSAIDMASKFLSGKIDKYKGFERILIDSMEIKNSRSFSVLHADGEPFEWSGDISISVIHKGIKVISG